MGVLQPRDNHLPIGMALQVGRTERGLAAWSLYVHGADVAGGRVIADRRFVMVR
jgi:hypothetical protein